MGNINGKYIYCSEVPLQINHVINAGSNEFPPDTLIFTLSEILKKDQWLRIRLLNSVELRWVDLYLSPRDDLNGWLIDSESIIERFDRIEQDKAIDQLKTIWLYWQTEQNRIFLGLNKPIDPRDFRRYLQISYPFTTVEDISNFDPVFEPDQVQITLKQAPDKMLQVNSSIRDITSAWDHARPIPSYLQDFYLAHYNQMECVNEMQQKNWGLPPSKNSLQTNCAYFSSYCPLTNSGTDLSDSTNLSSLTGNKLSQQVPIDKSGPISGTRLADLIDPKLYQEAFKESNNETMNQWYQILFWILVVILIIIFLILLYYIFSSSKKKDTRVFLSEEIYRGSSADLDDSEEKFAAQFESEYQSGLVDETTSEIYPE